jgi:hypothetical protein
VSEGKASGHIPIRAAQYGRQHYRRWCLVLVPTHQLNALTLREGATLPDRSSEGCAHDGFAMLSE